VISTIELENKVIRTGLCVNCGACQGLCPYWSEAEGRTIKYFDCSRENGRCVQFCPRMPVDLGALREKFFEKDSIIPEIGPYKALYLTRAADAKIRENSQHGGSMTALLELAINEGFIDAAVMTKTEGTLGAKGVVATNADEIRACSGSSFQIPAALKVLNEALKENKYKKIGVVGTPCKTLAAYKMRAKPFEENGNNAENIGMIFGLFCGWGLDWKGLEALVDKYTTRDVMKHMDILPSKYHSMELNTKGGVKSVDLDEIYPLVKNNCKYCTDLTSEFADISVGGARSADGWEVDKGWNQVIVRTEKGMELLKIAREKGVLEFKELPETALDKIKGASMGKKRTGVKNLKELTGGLGYLEPSAKLFENI